MSIARHRWTICSAGLVGVYAAVALSLPRHSLALVSLGDLVVLALMAVVAVLALMRALATRGQVRAFWALIAAGGLLWGTNQGMWTFYEVVLHAEVPDPFSGDVILFLHLIPFMAAVAMRPHFLEKGYKLYLGTLNFMMLLVWWVFLYAYIIFPDEYIVLNKVVYSRNYDRLYQVENLVLLVALGFLGYTTRNAWRRIYWNLFIAAALYSVSSAAINAAIASETYYSGSLYDIPLIVSVGWMARTILLARRLNPASDEAPAISERWRSLPPRLAMLAMLSLPVLGFWAIYHDTTRAMHFRVQVTLAAFLVLGIFVFMRQYLLDHELLRLLRESRSRLENLQRVQQQLVQKEKLASLGQLVAGAAHEINNPLAAILGYSELLSHAKLSPEHQGMIDKIGLQARRTRDLVSGLISFGQQASGEKTSVDPALVLRRAVQTQLLRLEGRKIKVLPAIPEQLPHIWGDANQLFQSCLHIINNAADALEEVGGGTLSVCARSDNGEVVLEFLDSGPGMRDPQKVFDPFYTTKPVGKGTGLGLSATYGVVQDHGGQITCFNRPEGGAAFVLRFPVAARETAVEMAAAKA